MAVFALQPLAVGAWLALIPQVKADLGLSKSELAVALLGNPIAVLSTIALAGFLIGPPTIGILADAFGLRIGLGVLLPLLALARLLVTWLAPVTGPIGRQ